MKWRDIADLVKEMTEKDLDQPVLVTKPGDLYGFSPIIDSDSYALRNADGSIDFDNGQHYLVLG